MKTQRSFIHGMYDASPGGWGWAYAYGYLEGIVRQYLNGSLSRERFTARFAVVNMFEEAYGELILSGEHTPAAAMAELVRYANVSDGDHPAPSGSGELSPG